MNIRQISPQLDSGVPSDFEELNGEFEEDGEDMDRIFAGIDWATANLGALEQEWRNQLAEIEQENVRALIESANKSQTVLPALKRAMEEVKSVEDLLSEYCGRLQVMGREIQQIDQLNRGLNVQTANQQRLLLELSNLIERISLSEEELLVLEQATFTDVAKLGVVEAAASRLLGKTSMKFEDGLGSMVAVRERMEFYAGVQRRFVERLSNYLVAAFSQHRERVVGAKGSRRASLRLVGMDDMTPFLQRYSPLIAILRDMDHRKHVDMVSAYQNVVSAVIRKDLSDVTDYLRSARLPKKCAEEKPYLFVSLSSAGGGLTASLRVGGSGGGASGGASGGGGGGGHQKSSSISGSARSWSRIPLFSASDIPELSSNEMLSPGQALHYVILIVALFMAHQMEICTTVLFDTSSAASVSEDERRTKLIESLLMAAFLPVDEVIAGFVDSLVRSDNSVAIELMVVLDLRIPELLSSLSTLGKSLQNLKRRLAAVAEQFINDQVAAIDSIKFSARKRSGVFPFVAVFPTFLSRMETFLVEARPDSSIREIMTRAYEKIIGAIFGSLDALQREAKQSADEKDLINASVMNIQNGQHLVTQLGAMQNRAAEIALRHAQKRYDQHLALYAEGSMHRVLPRLLDFFAGLSSLLTTTPANEVAFHASYNKASARRVLSGLTLRELRKSLELVHGRVLKHFDGADGVLLRQRVWRSIQEWFVAEYRRWMEIIESVYPGTDVQLPFGVADVTACFAELHV